MGRKKEGVREGDDVGQKEEKLRERGERKVGVRGIREAEIEDECKGERECHLSVRFIQQQQ